MPLKLFYLNLEKIKFRLKYKKENLYIIHPIIAFCTGRIILIDKLFKKFNYKEKTSVIYHEIYHKKFFNRIKFGIKSLFDKKYNSKQLEEFAADKYAATKNGKENMISVLNRIGLLVKNKEIKYDKKYHPTLRERIKKLLNQKF